MYIAKENELLGLIVIVLRDSDIAKENELLGLIVIVLRDSNIYS